MPFSTARFVAATRLGHVSASSPAREPRNADRCLELDAPEQRPAPAARPAPRERASLRRLLAWVRLVRA
jgi:hypothetical protein